MPAARRVWQLVVAGLEKFEELLNGHAALLNDAAENAP